MTPTTPDQHDGSLSPLDRIVEQFLKEYREGLRPEIEDYCSQNPEYAHQLRPILSSVLLLEKTRPALLNDVPVVRLTPERLGDYRLISEVGSGGMGVVYEAIQESLGRRVAIKTLPNDFAHYRSKLERFLREARAVACLHHSNIVSVFAVGEDLGVHYMVMPYIDGVDLGKVLKQMKRLASGNTHASCRLADTDDLLRSPPLSPVGESIASAMFRQWCDHSRIDAKIDSRFGSNQGFNYWQHVANIGLQVADAIHYAASQGVLHRDIKPSNLILDVDRFIWITDFGLAKIANHSELTESGEMLGTFRYLAPERLDGVHDIRGDIYGLGLTLYELVTLSIPLEGNGQAELSQQILTKEPTRPRKIDSRIPVDLETIIQKAIAKRPEQRYQTAAEMGEDLRLFLEDRPIKSRRSGAIERSWRWCQRNPATAGLLLCISLLAATTIGIYVVSNVRVFRETTAKLSALRAERIALRERENAFEDSQANAELAQRRFYAAQTNLAGNAFHAGDVTRAEDLLNSVIPYSGQTDFRGFEWDYLIGELHQGLRQSLLHPHNEIMCLSFAPDGSQLLIAGGNLQGGFACLTNVDQGIKLFQTSKLDCNVNGCAFAPDGSAFAIGLGDGRLLVFDGNTFQQTHSDEISPMIKSLAWSPDGKQIVVGSESGEIRCWQMPEFTATSIPLAHREAVSQLFFSHDSSRLYSSSDSGGHNAISRQWDATKSPMQEVRTYSDRSISDESPDGKTLAAINGGKLELLDASDGRLIEQIVVSSGPLVAAKFQLDGNALFVASRTDRAVRKYDRKNLRMIQATAQAHTVSALAIGPAGRFWAAGDAHGDVRVWDLRNPHPKSVLVDPSIHSVFVPPDQNNEIVLGGTESSQRWTPTSRSIRPFHKAKGLHAISRDAKTMICIPGGGGVESKTVEVWREGASEPQTIVLPHPIFEQCLAISASGRWLATRAERDPIAVYDLQTSPPRQVHNLVANCYHIAFSPDERLLVGGEQYGSVCCFEVATGTKLTNFAEFDSFWAWGTSVAFSNDNRYVASGSESGTVRVWEIGSRDLVATLLGQPGEIRSIAFFPDGRRLAVGGTGDVRIWDFQTGQELLALPVSGQRVTSLVVNTTGDTLAAVASEGHVHVWTGKSSSNSRTIER